MPTRVHAILVVRPEGRTPASLHLKRTLAALTAQTRPADELTIVVCGQDALVAERIAGADAAVLPAPRGESFADAAARAETDADADSAVWLLAQDTAPEPDALALLVAGLEQSQSIAVVAPKLVRWEGRGEMVSLGESMTRLGRAVPLAAGELDQGQHDADEDVLGADIRGLLARGDVWRTLGGIDPALEGADEGLDLGVRARLAGHRVVVVPSARVAVAGDGVAGPPDPIDGRRQRRRAFAARTAQLHRRLAYTRAILLPLQWLSLLPLAVVRTAAQLIAKTPGLVGPEWAAAAVAFVRFGAIARSRRRIRAARTTSWAQLAPLRVTRGQLDRRLDGGDVDAPAESRGDLRFLSGGGAWAVLAALAVSLGAFTALLAWPVLGGGGMLPLPATPASLWADAAWGVRDLGADVVGPADPFAGVVAVLGSLWAGDPSTALVVLWMLALPLAVLGGWFASTRITERSSLRIFAGVAWALAPTFLAALQQGRPAAVLAHLLLPWLLYAGAVAHRSWVAAAAASLLLLAVTGCAPVLAPALMLAWTAAVVLAALSGAGRGIPKLVWVLIPSAVLAGPLVWRQLSDAQPLALLADPGLTWSGPQVAADPVGRMLLTFGFPTADPGGWTSFLGEDATAWWVPLLVAPLLVAGLAAAVTRRWLPGVVLLVLAVSGLTTAFAAPGIAIAYDQSTPVALWPGTGLSLAWAGIVGAALTTLAAPARIRTPAALAPFVLGLCLAVLAIPMLTALPRGDSLLADGQRSTMPAYVAAQGSDDPDVGTLVLTPQNAGGVAAEVVWGPGETLSGQTTIVAARTDASAADERIAKIAADLIASTSADTVAELADEGISFILLAPAADPVSAQARALSLHAVTSIDQRADLVAVGETTRGDLWRLATSPEERTGLSAAERAAARTIGGVQIVVLVIALLLAVPTAASVRAARRMPRTVGVREVAP